MRNIIEMTWEDIKKLDKEKSVLMVTVAPIEEHSLCLPIGTDVYEGEGWIEKTSEFLENDQNELQCYKLPAFPVACASANGFYGCIHFTPKTTYLVVKELLQNLASWGMKHIVVIASHADPIHQIAIEKACDEVNDEFGVCAISPLGALFSADQLHLGYKMPEEASKIAAQAPNDYHAGWVETSMMLAMKEKLVKREYTELPDTEISDRDMISPEKQLAAMGEFGHLGCPRYAEQQVGTLLNENTAQFLMEVIKAFVSRKGYQIYMHHFLYHVPVFQEMLHS